MNQNSDVNRINTRWKDLYIVGGICGVAVSVLTVAAIVIYFIWPYQPGLTTVSEIFSTIQANTLKGLMSMDLMMVIATFIIIPFFIAVYVSTKQANESYALIALVFGLISCILAFFMRPIMEMVYLSGLYF